MKSRQLKLLADQPKAFGGELLKTRKGRSQPRPLSTRESMHLVLRSSKAKGAWAFNKGSNSGQIEKIVLKFAGKYGVKIYSLANVGNHLHFHIKLSNRHLYRPFIRAITAAIAMKVTGASRWKKLKSTARDRFWDYRPYTRVVRSWRAFLSLKDYIRVNSWEGWGSSRQGARFLVAWDRASLEDKARWRESG